MTTIHQASIVEKELRWHAEADTQSLAQQLARALARNAATRNTYIELRGDLGAGKTTFVRHLLRALGIQGRIKSPTYAIAEQYTSALAPGAMPPTPIWHFDFYRFKDPQEWEDAGFRDIFAAEGIKLAEWPENVTGLAPAADLTLKITMPGKIPPEAPPQRDVLLQAHSKAGQQLIDHIPQ